MTMECVNFSIDDFPMSCPPCQPPQSTQSRFHCTENIIEWKLKYVEINGLRWHFAVYKSCFVIFNFPIRSILRRFRPISGRNFEHLANGLGSIWTPSGGEMTWEMSLYVFVFHCVSGKLEAAGNVLHKNDQEWSLSRTDLPQLLRTASIGASFSVLDTSSQAQREVEGLGVKKQENAIEIQYLYIYMCISKHFILYNM